MSAGAPAPVFRSKMICIGQPFSPMTFEPTPLHVSDVASEYPEPGPERDMAIARYFAKWGADQEAASRPILKSEAIAVLNDADLDSAHYNVLLRALEQLPCP